MFIRSVQLVCRYPFGLIIPVVEMALTHFAAHLPHTMHSCTCPLNNGLPVFVLSD